MYNSLEKGKVHLCNDFLIFDPEGNRVSGVNFDFEKSEIHLTLSKGGGALEKRNSISISFESAQRIGLLNLEVLKDEFKKF